MPAYVIRHAKAGDRSDWQGDDRERPLTKPGGRQAQEIASRLETKGIGAVISSPYTRCVQTVEPLAQALRLTVQTSVDLAEGAGLRGLIGVIRTFESRTPALCTHGDIVEELLLYLIDRDIIARSQGGNEKGGTWTLDVRGGVIRGASYLAAPKT